MKHKLNILSKLLILGIIFTSLIIGTQLACADKGAPPGVTVVELSDEGDRNTDIRQLSEDERVKVLNIALADIRFQEITNELDYHIGRIDNWVDEDCEIKIGGVVEVILDTPQTISYEWPRVTFETDDDTLYKKLSIPSEVFVETLYVGVDLKTEEVIKILPMPPVVLESFYGASSELKAELEQIALKDTRISELIQANEDTISIGDYTINENNYGLAVGVRLKEGVTLAEYKDWKSGKNDLDIIDEYVGVLNIGYNDRYHLVFDLQKGEVKEIRQDIKSGSIPELTGEEKQRAIDIALADETLQYILQGKEYEVGKIGVWHSGDTKLGASFDIVFNETYVINCTLPNYYKEPHHINEEVESLMVIVHLVEGRIVTIIAVTPM